MIARLIGSTMCVISSHFVKIRVLSPSNVLVESYRRRRIVAQSLKFAVQSPHKALLYGNIDGCNGVHYARAPSRIIWAPKVVQI